ncbi:hypothetical protein SAMN04487970_10859 [Paenibacillus tianmuensis]|uniref:Uncharacterized protein n=1 Tax=Paenibacillus tianmuensis TaxID=624147 RepID=A0A1G4U0E9_9BACL|nr:hypothetical protein [Paenibacillus tianmuensis]SCW87058.1 hypothetical protein SAMN04487970_10859 [Paenibacillus tianmuensis]
MNYMDAGPVKAANKAAADQTEKVIDLTNQNGFHHIILDCSKCTSEVMFSIDVPISKSDKIIYVAPKFVFDGYIRGKKLYYKCAADSNEFNYVLL